MTYFADLTPYSYSSTSDQSILNIGWLDKQNPFPVGFVDPNVLLKLFKLCKTKTVKKTRGFHLCNMCRRQHLKFELDGDHVFMGTSEIRVPGKNGIIYAAPTLILHYIREHNYLPPEEFVDAVLGLR